MGFAWLLVGEYGLHEASNSLAGFTYRLVGDCINSRFEEFIKDWGGGESLFSESFRLGLGFRVVVMIRALRGLGALASGPWL